MKKIISIILLICISTFTFAKGFGFEFKGLDMYPDFWKGPTPSYLEAGFSYNFGNQLLDGDTKLEVIVGGGYVQRTQFINASKALIDPKVEKPSVFDSAVALLRVSASQGMLESPFSDNNLLTLKVGYELHYEKAFDPYDLTKHPSTISTLGYPELKAPGYDMLLNILKINLKVDMNKDSGTKQEGFLGIFNLDISPMKVNALSSDVSIYDMRIDAIGSYTPYQLLSKEGLNYFSITLINRIVMQYVDGNIPSFVTKSASLGRKVRGYASYAYATRFSLVNNLEVRLNLPDMGVKGLFFRVIGFLDLGFGANGSINLPSKEEKYKIGSYGAIVTLSIFDFFDVGYFVGGSFGEINLQKPDTRLRHGLVFGLDF